MIDQWWWIDQSICMMVIVSIDVAKWLITFISWWWWLIDGKIQIKKLTSQFSYKFIKQVFGWRAKKDFMRIVARSKWSHLTRNIIFCRLASCSTIQVKKNLKNYDNMTIVVWGALRSVDFIPSGVINSKMRTSSCIICWTECTMNCYSRKWRTMARIR